MNKDVIYIEPEDDITDILANIKDAKNKIIALVPPKKAGVLQSAVNFKLIAKTATQYEKTVVLITSDNSLLALADKVKMPTAKTLQSKPKLPNSDSAEEFGDKDEEEADDAISDDDAEEPEEEEEPIEEPHHKKTEKASKKDDAKKAGAAVVAKKAKDVDLELDAEDVESDDDEKSSKKEKSDKKKSIKVPNFKKYRKFIILAVVLLVVFCGFGYWATAIAPRAKISVKVKTTAANFNQTVSFVTDETKSDPENGIFYVEKKDTTKKASADFEATGQVDKGTKASGTITVTRPKGDSVSADDLNFSISANTTVTINGKQYMVTEGGSANATLADLETCGGTVFAPKVCLKKDISSGKIAVVAKEVGEGYNIAAATSGISLSISTNKKYTVTSSAMTGGTSKIVKVVSPEDVEKANNELTGETDKEAREELTSQFSSEYILISNSFAVENSGFTTSPSVNQEVGDGVTPKIARETKYVIYAVKKDDINAYIRKVAEEKIKGDKTQMVYSTGIATEEGEEDKAFFESYKNENGNMTAKLKSTTKTGPRITEDMVKEVSLGVKIGKVQSNLRSYNGVTEANVETSYFWVTSVPNDDNKVEIEITVE